MDQGSARNGWWRELTRFRLRTMLLVVAAFAIGFGARNLADGLSVFSTTLGLPASDSVIHPGDELLVESLADPTLNRRIVVLADRTVTLPLLGTISVEGETVTSMQQLLTVQYGAHYKQPSIQVYRAGFSEPLRE